MRNFQKLGEVNCTDLLHAVQRQSDLWNSNDLRTKYPNSPHKDADDIWLRFNDKKDYGDNPQRVMDDVECVNYEAWVKLPQAHEIIFNLMRFVRGVRLGRVVITRLAAGRIITPHKDGGKYAEYYDRYHCILQNFPGSIFRGGKESLVMKNGEIYWFNNLEEHEIKNYSSDDRITMIIDIRNIK